MELQTKVYTQTNNGFTLELTLVENSISTTGNTSSIGYALKLKSTTKDFSQYGVGATVQLDGKTVATRDRYSASQISIGTYASVTLLSGTTMVGHGANGQKSMSVKFTLDMATASWTPGPMTGTATVTLTNIPRQATITSAPNFTDEDNPVLKYDNPAGTAASLQACIATTAGTVKVAYRTVTGSSYTFNLTSEERDALRGTCTTSNAVSVRFYLKTTIGGQTFTAYSTKTLTIRNPAPTLSPTVVDANSTTVALTGDANILLKYHSNAKVTTGATAVKKASIKSQKVTCGRQTLAGNGTFNGVESGNFTFEATDSRGNTTRQTVIKTVVDYSKPTISIDNSMPDLSGQFAFKVSGSFFNGNFGAVTNALTVQYRFRELNGAYGSYQPMTVSKSGNTYTAVANLSGLDADKTYQFQAKATDKLETVTTSEKEVKILPVCDWCGTDFNFNVPVTVQGVQICKNNVLWSGAWWPSDTQKSYFSAPVSQQQTGIVLVFSYYDNGPKDWDFNFQFVPKWFVEMLPGCAFSFGYAHLYNEYFATKTLQIFDTYLVGGAHNSSGANGPGANGITTTNNKQVLRYVIGV